MDRETTAPPFTLDHNEDNGSSLRSRSYGGAEPPDRSQVLFILSTSTKKINQTNDNNPMAETPNTDYTEPPSITVIPNHQTDNPSESTPTNSTTDIPTALPDTNTTTQQPDIMNPAVTGNVIIDGE